MKLSELMEKLNDIIEENSVKHAPFDPDVYFDNLYLDNQWNTLELISSVELDKDRDIILKS